MATFYLDTSAINHLCDDPRSSFLKEAIQKSTIVYPSIFTIIEIASTSVEQRRIDLLKLAKDISRNFRPLATPGDLLRRSLESVKVWASDMDNSMGTEWDGVWIALNDPNRIDMKAHREIIEWKKRQEQWFQDMHVRGRPHIQAAIEKLPQSEQTGLTSSYSELIRRYPLDNQFLIEFVHDIASHSGTKVTVDKELVQRIIKQSEHWRFFLASMAYGIYARSIKTSQFAKDKNPGSIDTQQAIYLATCDIFVTADRQQHRMLRLLEPFGHKKRLIWDYSKFVESLCKVERNC